MPEFIVAVVAWAGAEIGGTIGAYMMLEFTASMASAALLAGGLAYSSMKARQAQAQARDQYNASQVDRMLTISSAVAPRELVLGQTRKAGTVFYKASTGTDNRDLYLAIAIAGHEVQEIGDIYLNDVLVTLDGSGYVTTEPYNISTTASGQGVTPPAGATNITEVRDGGADGGTPTGVYNYQYVETASVVKITKHLGAAGQTVDADLHAAFPTEWPSTNTCAGVAYLVCKFTYNETAFSNGLPNVTCVVKGAKVYDPRSASTAWSDNPALLMRHVYQHAKFGKATVTSTEDARFTAAANACDASTVYTVGGVAQSARALYKASVVAPFGTPAKSLFDDLSQAMGGSWAFAGGELYLKVGTYTAPVMTLTEADLAVIKRSGAAETQSPIAISVHKERAQRFNTVKPTIWDAAQDYKQVALTPLAASALIARDGVELVQEVNMPAVFYAPQALHISGILMRDARDPLVVDLPFKLRAYPLELFDTVSLTLARYGWTAKTFMVLGRTWNMDGSIQLTLKETSASITQMDADFLPQGWAANTNLPTPWAVAGVGTLTVASGTAELMKQSDGTIVSRMRITWAQVPDAAVVQNGQIEVQYRKSDETGAWTSITVPGNETQAITSEVQDGLIYIVRARAKTTVAVGDWCAQVEATIVGKTAAPSNVAGFAYTTCDTGVILTWDECTDADYAATEIRVGASWATADLLFTGKASTYSALNIPDGSWTVLACHIDTSGNLSTTPTSISVTFARTRIVNFIGDYSSAPATSGHKKDEVYKNTADGNTYILNADAGTWVLWIAKGSAGATGSTGATGATGSPGADGSDGARGSLTGYGANYGISSSSWSASQAQAVIYNMLYSGSLTSYGSTWHLRIGDTVTLSDSTHAFTKVWSGSSWVSPGVVIDGNLVVTGTLIAGTGAFNQAIIGCTGYYNGSPTLSSGYVDVTFSHSGIGTPMFAWASTACTDNGGGNGAALIWTGNTSSTVTFRLVCWNLSTGAPVSGTVGTLKIAVY